MHLPTNLTDFSVWTGNWPFLKLRYAQELDELKKKLQSLQITRAFVAPAEAILEQDPLRANKALLTSINDDFFSPVMIIDLSYTNWEESIACAVADGRVRMVKLLPNYHLYELEEKRLAPLVKLTQMHRMIISIQVRIEDRRGMYPLMKVDDVDVVKAVKTMAYFPEQRFILSNAYLGELTEVLHSIDNVWVDLSSLEHIDLIEMLQRKYSLDKILFASHCPFYYPEGAAAKLKYTDAALAAVHKVASLNAERLLRSE